MNFLVLLRPVIDGVRQPASNDKCRGATARFERLTPAAFSGALSHHIRNVRGYTRAVSELWRLGELHSLSDVDLYQEDANRSGPSQTGQLTPGPNPNDQPMPNFQFTSKLLSCRLALRQPKEQHVACIIAALVHASNLHSLVLEMHGRDDLTIDLSPLATLHSLTHLELLGTAHADETLRTVKQLASLECFKYEGPLAAEAMEGLCQPPHALQRLSNVDVSQRRLGLGHLLQLRYLPALTELRPFGLEIDAIPALIHFHTLRKLTLSVSPDQTQPRRFMHELTAACNGVVRSSNDDVDKNDGSLIKDHGTVDAIANPTSCSSASSPAIQHAQSGLCLEELTLIWFSVSVDDLSRLLLSLTHLRSLRLVRIELLGPDCSWMHALPTTLESLSLETVRGLGIAPLESFVDGFAAIGRKCPRFTSLGMIGMYLSRHDIKQFMPPSRILPNLKSFGYV